MGIPLWVERILNFSRCVTMSMKIVADFYKFMVIQSCLLFRMTVVANATHLSCARLVAFVAVCLPIWFGWVGAADVAVRCGTVKACILVVLMPSSKPLRGSSFRCCEIKC